MPIGAKTMVPTGAKPKPKLNLRLKKREKGTRFVGKNQSFTIDFFGLFVIFKIKRYKLGSNLTRVFAHRDPWSFGTSWHRAGPFGTGYFVFFEKGKRKRIIFQCN